MCIDINELNKYSEFNLIIRSDNIDETYKMFKIDELKRLFNKIRDIEDKRNLFLAMYDAIFRMVEVVICDYNYILCTDKAHVAVTKIYHLLFPGLKNINLDFYNLKRYRMNIVKKGFNIDDYHLEELRKYFLHARTSLGY